MFLTIVTRTFNRPARLEENCRSLEEQTDKDFEHLVVEDRVGIGIPATYVALRSQEVDGEYVWLFDDDNVLWDKDFIAKLKKLSEQKPDVILAQVKVHTAPKPVPSVWPPIAGDIDAMSYIVTKEMWYKHRRDFGARYEGDYDFIASVATSNPKVAWMDGIVGGTQRTWKRGVAREIAEGSKVRIRVGVSGLWGSYDGNQIVTITKQNADLIESLLRAGHAEELDAIPVERMSAEEIKARNRILVFCPTAPRLELETVDAIFTQQGVKFFDVMFTRDNPYSSQWDDVYKNVQLNYEKMRQVVLSQDYQKVWTVESDVIPPPDALSKFLEVDAPVVSGLYAHRHGIGIPNLLRAENSLNPGSGMEWEEIKKFMPRTIEVSGTAMGCCLIDRSAIETFNFITMERGAPDTPFLRYCWKNGIKQMARLDVLCGHKKPSGEILWPQQFLNGKNNSEKGD